MKREGIRQVSGQWVRFIGVIFTKLWSKRKTLKQRNNPYLLRAIFFWVYLD